MPCKACVTVTHAAMPDLHQAWLLNFILCHLTGVVQSDLEGSIAKGRSLVKTGDIISWQKGSCEVKVADLTRMNRCAVQLV